MPPWPPIDQPIHGTNYQLEAFVPIVRAFTFKYATVGGLPHLVPPLEVGVELKGVTNTLRLDCAYKIYFFLFEVGDPRTLCVPVEGTEAGPVITLP